MGIKRDPLDIVFSLLVRERADWTCECCGKEFPERKGAGLHCSHYWGRRNRGTRWNGVNCFAHCFGCHQKLGSNPELFRTWVFKELGELLYDELTLRANAVMKYTPSDRKEMKAHFSAQLEYLKKRRKNGATGYIDFSEWD